MAKILVINNYSLADTQAKVDSGLVPDHFLFGINHFRRRGHEVELVPEGETGRLLRLLGRCWPDSILPLGHLGKQWYCLRRLNDADILYSACQMDSHVLGYLRAAGVIRIPIVCLAHHLLNPGRMARLRQPLFRLMVRGVDEYPSLSRLAAEQINRLSGGRQRSVYLPWGPDASFYPPCSDAGEGVIAAGRTGRDFETFGLAASMTSSKARIICIESNLENSFQRFGRNVVIEAHPDGRMLPLRDLVTAFAAARVLAIPLYAGSAVAGLSSLMDALGMGKPVIVTRHPLIDLDVEALGIGLSVGAGDVEGWRQAIQWFEDHPDEARDMGQRSRDLVSEGMNSASFADRLLEIFERTIGAG